jgi:hypothetical protein
MPTPFSLMVPGPAALKPCLEDEDRGKGVHFSPSRDLVARPLPAWPAPLPLWSSAHPRKTPEPSTTSANFSANSRTFFACGPSVPSMFKGKANDERFDPELLTKRGQRSHILDQIFSAINAVGNG